ncbi:MAG: aldo/keto reductase [Candidatus Promineifilaceae bacterium]|jgi:aryl-alcohol dehydrogenase-like predicted oxidoreductase
METIELGRSQLPVTRMGLGLAALGRPGYINLGHADDLESNYEIKAMEEHAHEVLDAAWDLGIRYFDAARSYGRAENFLASWLTFRDIDPQSVTVGSKWGYTYTADWNVTAEHHEIKEHSLAVLNRQILESRSLLGAQLDLYQIHSATLESGVLENDQVLSRLAELRDSGLAIGMSMSGPAQSEILLRAMEIEYGGQPLFSAVQATWNLLAQEAGDTLSQAHEAGMGVVIKEAVANGRLTDRNLDPAFEKQRALLESSAQALDTTIDALALAAVLAQPWVDVVLSGAAQVEHIVSNVKAFDVKAGDWLDELLAALREKPQQYWQMRSGLDWN